MPLLKMRLLSSTVLISTGTAVSCEFQTADFSGGQSAIRRAIIAYRAYCRKKPQSFEPISMTEASSKLRVRNWPPCIVECALAVGRVCPIQSACRLQQRLDPNLTGPSITQNLLRETSFYATHRNRTKQCLQSGLHTLLSQHLSRRR